MTSFVPSALTFDQDLDDDDEDETPAQGAAPMEQTRPTGATVAQRLMSAVTSAVQSATATTPATISKSSARSISPTTVANGVNSHGSPASPTSADASKPAANANEAATSKKRKAKSDASPTRSKRANKGASPTPVRQGAAGVPTPAVAPPAPADPAEEEGSSSESEHELDLMEGIKAEDVKEKLSYLEFDDSGGCVAGAGLQYYTHEKQRIIQQYTQVVQGVSGSGDRLFCYDHKKVRLPHHLAKGADGLYHCTETSPCTNVGRQKRGEGGSRTTNRYHAPQYCANCNMPGHLPRECPNPRQFSDRVCFICASTEHQMQACPNALPERSFDDDMRVGILTQQPCTPTDLAMLTCFVCFQRGHCDCSEPGSEAFLGERVCAGRCSVCAGPHSLRDCAAIRQLASSSRGGRYPATPQPSAAWPASPSPSGPHHPRLSPSLPRYPDLSPPSPHSAPLPPRPQLTPVLQRSATLQQFSPLPPRPPALNSSPYGSSARPLAPRPPLLAPIRPYGASSSPRGPWPPLGGGGGGGGGRPVPPPPYNPYGGAGPRAVPRTQPLAPQLPSGRFARY